MEWTVRIVSRRSPGSARSASRTGHGHLARDHEVELVQQVERLPDRPELRALDGDHAGVDIAVANGLEDSPEGGHRLRCRRIEPAEHGILGERARLPRVAHRPARHCDLIARS